jgi:hypothetical protein
LSRKSALVAPTSCATNALNGNFPGWCPNGLSRSAWMFKRPWNRTLIVDRQSVSL